VRVVHVVDRLDARAAGVGYAVAQWAAAERELGIDAQVVTADHEHAFGVAVAITCSRALRAVSAADLVHLHALWIPSTWIAGWMTILARKPYVITPHGMLDAWALRRSRWKKLASAALFERMLVSRAACLHALCASELQAARAFGRSGPIAVIPPGIDETLLDTPADPELNAPYALFLGRLHPKKGIDILIRAFAKVRQRYSRWRLVIAGPDEGGHRRELEALVREEGLGDAVSFAGEVHGAEKVTLLRRASVFALTSHSEGLPVAVLEAMACGVPVLVSKQCNIEDVHEAGAGYVGNTTVERSAELLEALMALDARSHCEMGQRGRDLVVRRFTRRASAREMVEVYQWLLRGGTQPTQVQEDHV